ncbi:MAG TPA: ABC-type transport auxiliary lipoprotein family protein [Rhizorhapis sp.]
MRLSLLPLLLLTPLSACISFGGKAPDQLLSLTAESSLPAGTVRNVAVGAGLVVAVPETPRKIDTYRVAVQVDETSIAYVADTQWVDRPGRLFQRLLSETIAANTGRVVLNPDQFSGEPSTRLQGELIDFGIDARSSQAVVTYDAILLGDNGATMTKRRFSATRPVSPIEPARVGRALNDAANDVAAQVAVWVG